MTQPTFAALQNTVAKMEIERGNLADRLDDVLDRARGNADDTVYLEKTVPVTEYDAIGLATVGEILSYSTDQEVCAWFAAQGVTW